MPLKESLAHYFKLDKAEFTRFQLSGIFFKNFSIFRQFSQQVSDRNRETLSLIVSLELVCLRNKVRMIGDENFSVE